VTPKRPYCVTRKSVSEIRNASHGGVHKKLLLSGMRLFIVRQKGTNVSQDPTAPIFRVEEQRKKEGKLVRVHGVGGIVLQLHSFLTSALDIGEQTASRPSRFTPSKELRYA